MVLIEQMLFDSPAPLKAEEPHAPGLTEALGKRLLAGEPGVEHHRVAQQQLIMAVMAQQQQVLVVDQHLAPQSAP